MKVKDEMKKNKTIYDCFLSAYSTADSRAELDGILFQMMLAGIMLTASVCLCDPVGDGGRKTLTAGSPECTFVVSCEARYRILQ